jgi:hypothetical protein
MPDESSLINLLDRWINEGKLGFERGVVHEDEVAIYFRLMNKAISERQASPRTVDEEFPLSLAPHRAR